MDSNYTVTHKVLHRQTTQSKPGIPVARAQSGSNQHGRNRSGGGMSETGVLPSISMHNRMHDISSSASLELDQQRTENIQQKLEVNKLRTQNQKLSEVYKNTSENHSQLQTEFSALYTLTNALQAERKKYQATADVLLSDPKLSEVVAAAKERTAEHHAQSEKVLVLETSLAKTTRQNKAQEDKLVVLDEYVTKVLRDVYPLHKGSLHNTGKNASGNLGTDVEGMTNIGMTRIQEVPSKDGDTHLFSVDDNANNTKHASNNDLSPESLLSGGNYKDFQKRWESWVGCEYCHIAPTQGVLSKAEVALRVHCQPIQNPMKHTRMMAVHNQNHALALLQQLGSPGMQEDDTETRALANSYELVKEVFADISGVLSRQAHVISSQRDALKNQRGVLETAEKTRDTATSGYSKVCQDRDLARDESLHLQDKVEAQQKSMQALQIEQRQEKILKEYFK